MQKGIPILGLFAILVFGFSVPAYAENSDNYWEDKYDALHYEYGEQRWNIEEEFDEKFEELSKYYEDQKLAIYEKIELDPSLSDEEIDKMFIDLFNEFEQKEYDLKEDFEMALKELDMMFDDKFEEIDREYNKQYDEKHEDYDDPYKNDPEWKSIEPLTEKILDSIPMEKIQRLWEAGEMDSLLRLIVSETDLTEEEAKKVISFFERYDDKDYHDYEYDEYYEDPYYTEENFDNSHIMNLEKRITELEKENNELRSYIAELEQRVSDINAVMMEQVKFIYEWVLSQ